jgi:hypothetical protein
MVPATGDDANIYNGFAKTYRQRLREKRAAAR